MDSEQVTKKLKEHDEALKKINRVIKKILETQKIYGKILEKMFE